jgi:glycine betaine catabolism B
LLALVGLKLLIARRYKHLYSMLAQVGTAIFATSFVLVSLPLLSQVLQASSPTGLRLTPALLFAIPLCLVLYLLAIKRSKKHAMEVTRPRVLLAPPGGAALTKSQKGGAGSMTLLLAHIEQQTHDTKTLRFLLPEGTSFRARPGQFLTFHWFIKGKRITRAYTISSSPSHAKYVEITPKRVENGCVSNYLHDEAKLGLTVEATGPHGKFFFDETVHRSIVLIAAGSGVTPMISILRYIDSLRLPTHVTLLYCVRSRNDIIFGAELERLQTSVPGFHYSVTLSQPDDNWTGNKGRLTQEYVFGHVNDLDRPIYFLCGPRGFMENARHILTCLGVDKERITEESFGETQRMSPTLVKAETIEFVRSHKICASSPDVTLLEVAEANGVQIPFGCRQGQCGTCATQVLFGSVDMETDTGLSADQKKDGFVLCCVSRAKGTVIVAA